MTDPSVSLPRTLNLGSGKKNVTGALNLDVTGGLGADVVHDLDVRPWPLPESQFDEVLANDVIEHLANVIDAFEEIHRVCRDGAVVRVTVPHFSCANAFTDPTHRHYFGYFSFDYLTGGNELSYYTSVKFRKRSVQMIFYPSLLNRMVWRLANRFPEAYERRWTWMFPAWFLSVELEVVKPG
jgi:SAM-dependent methyltransferase